MDTILTLQLIDEQITRSALGSSLSYHQDTLSYSLGKSENLNSHSHYELRRYLP